MVVREGDFIQYTPPAAPAPLIQAIPASVCSANVKVNGLKACVTPFSFEAMGLLFVCLATRNTTINAGFKCVQGDTVQVYTPGSPPVPFAVGVITTASTNVK